MKLIKFTALFVFLLIVSISSCKKNKTEPAPPEDQPTITSVEYEDELLFVNRSNFQIKTSDSATFSSNDPSIQISSSGMVKRITSGELVSIDITWTKTGKKTKIYALGATDNDHVKPFENYHAAEATDPYNDYRKGWKTLQKLPVTGETYAIILRHADADDGVDYSVNHDDDGPANWWKSCNNSIARQLNDVGKERATELGKIFKDLKYPIARVISSEFCRAQSTAQLINAGPTIKIDGRINHPAYNVSPVSLFRGMLAIMQDQPVDNKMTLMSAHHPINEMGKSSYPSFPNVSPFNWTGAYFIKIDADKTITYQGAASWGMFKYWRDKKLKKL